MLCMYIQYKMTIHALIPGHFGRAPLESGGLRPPSGRDRRTDDSCRVRLYSSLLLSTDSLVPRYYLLLLTSSSLSNAGE